MRIQLSGEEYSVKDETITVFFASILAYILAEYEKLPDSLKLLAMALTRGILLMSELKEQDPDKKKLFRPEKRGDPNLHLIRFLVDRLAAVVPGVEMEIVADDNRTISAVYLKNSNSGGGPLLADGGFGERQDDSCEALRPASSPVVSHSSSLHS